MRVRVEEVWLCPYLPDGLIFFFSLKQQESEEG